MSSQREVPLDLSMPRGRCPVQQDNQANAYSQHSYQFQRYPQTWTPYDLITIQPQAQPMSNVNNNFQGTSLSTNQSMPNSMEVYPGGYYTETSYVNECLTQRLNHRGNRFNQSRIVHKFSKLLRRWSEYE
ncbi:hypothetical protein ACOME3_002233 [Neoechinorhynchus agilis]